MAGDHARSRRLAWLWADYQAKALRAQYLWNDAARGDDAIVACQKAWVKYHLAARRCRRGSR
jgi:hypothetical protein